MIRQVEEQFEPSKAEQIRELQQLFQSLKFWVGAGPYYSYEIVRCLEAGLLLAALQVAAALLELFVRDFLVLVRFRSLYPENPISSDWRLGAIEKEIEDGRPRFDFNKMVNELVEEGVIDQSDFEEICGFYKNVRIPVHHGLSRRFTRTFSKIPIQEEDGFLSVLFLNQSIRANQFEKAIEDHTLVHLTTVGHFIKKYLPVVQELYSE